MIIVTLEEVKAHLRVDHELDDSDIELKADAAEAAVFDYIGDSQYLFLDTGGELLDLEDTTTDVVGNRALKRCKQAVLLLVGDWYTNRAPGQPADAQFAIAVGHGFIYRPVMALLYSLREPTVA